MCFSGNKSERKLRRASAPRLASVFQSMTDCSHLEVMLQEHQKTRSSDRELPVPPHVQIKAVRVMSARSCSIVSTGDLPGSEKSHPTYGEHSSGTVGAAQPVLSS